MFSKAEAKALNERFYTAFGVYMRKHQPQADYGLRWLNYNTGVKNVFFRVEADKRSGRVSIDLQHSDPGMRALFFEQFLEFKKILNNYMETELNWDLQYILPSGREISRIYVQKEGLSLYNEDDWRDFFEFFELYLIRLDAFWADFKMVFENFAH